MLLKACDLQFSILPIRLSKSHEIAEQFENPLCDNHSALILFAPTFLAVLAHRRDHCQGGCAQDHAILPYCYLSAQGIPD